MEGRDLWRMQGQSTLQSFRQKYLPLFAFPKNPLFETEVKLSIEVELFQVFKNYR